jgi:cytochrome c-type biogenesis protein CcmE
MPKATRTIIAIAVIAIFGVLGIWSLVGTATPYVDFDKARSLQKQVQVMGKIDFESTNYDAQTGVLSFFIINEEGDRMKVDYSGTKPGNFEQAESVVCIGRFQDDKFLANELLVKCPSKYQGPEYQENAESWGKGS